jgi:glycosyltransferase involved in cell wall biosynthesis
MRIVYNYHIFGAQKYGGISRYFYEIASRLSQLDGHSVKIVAPLYVNEYLRRGDIQVTGVYCPPVRRTGRMVNIINSTFANLLFKSICEADIFHETYYSIGDSKPRNAIRVITVYDMIYEKFRQTLSPDDSTLDVKAYSIRRADHVVCISENTRKDLIDILGVKKERTSVVYLGYSLGVENASINRLGGKPYILYVGMRGGYKNFATLLRAYAHSNRLKGEFDIYCFGGGKFTKPELALMSSLGLKEGSVVHFSGSDKLLAYMYSAAVAFVYPSLYEGFGIPPLEAMSCGCPVVCTNTSSLPEVVGDAAEMFDPTDEEAVRVAIERVVFSDDYRQDLVRRGRTRLAFFSWDKCAQDTLDVYQKLMGNC